MRRSPRVAGEEQLTKMPSNQYGKEASVLECPQCPQLREEPVSVTELLRFPKSCSAKEEGRVSGASKLTSEVRWGRCPQCLHALKLTPPVSETLGGRVHLGCSNWKGKPGGKCRGFVSPLSLEQERRLPSKLFVNLKRKFGA